MELKLGLTPLGLEKFEVFVFHIIELSRKLLVFMSGMGITKLAKKWEFQCLNIYQLKNDFFNILINFDSDCISRFRYYFTFCFNFNRVTSKLMID